MGWGECRVCVNGTRMRVWWWAAGGGRGVYLSVQITPPPFGDGIGGGEEGDQQAEIKDKQSCFGGGVDRPV